MIRTLNFGIHEAAPYIDWAYFFHAWGFPPRMAGIGSVHGCDGCRAQWLASFPEAERARAAEAMQLFKDAQRMLAQLDGEFGVHVRFGLFPAAADGDDLILYPSPERPVRLPLLRQQQPEAGAPCLCLSDFVRPVEHGAADTVGVFAGTIDADMEHLYESGEAADDFRHLLARTLADRLVEAAVEKMHEQVRKSWWGYASGEQLSMADMQAGRFQGIRPAVGYPSLPDQSINFLLASLLNFDSLGIRLTEHGAMMPHASVSGLLLAHPQARYFAVGRIGEDQLESYARRRDIPKEKMRKFLAANL